MANAKKKRVITRNIKQCKYTLIQSFWTNPFQRAYEYPILRCIKQMSSCRCFIEATKSSNSPEKIGTHTYTISKVYHTHISEEKQQDDIGVSYIRHTANAIFAASRNKFCEREEGWGKSTERSFTRERTVWCVWSSSASGFQESDGREMRGKRYSGRVNHAP